MHQSLKPTYTEQSLPEEDLGGSSSFSHANDIVGGGTTRYRSAGVNISVGEQVAKEAARLASSTIQNTEVMSGPGGFAAVYELPKGYREPVLVSATDGVGTKLRLATDWDNHNGIGVDLVAMCVNDVLTTGAAPLFFLDYYATGKLEFAHAKTILASIAEGCRQAKCALSGGETAEMPGHYQGQDYDLAGFCVGIAEKSKLWQGQKIKEGDALIGIASSGAHANGFSLIRQIIQQVGAQPSDVLDGDEHTLAEVLLEPTRIYTETLSRLQGVCSVKIAAHITGGGISGNLARVIPTRYRAVLDLNSCFCPPLFGWLQSKGKLTSQEMLEVFNCGVGMIIGLAREELPKALQALNTGKTPQAWHIGQIEASDGASRPVAYQHLTSKF